MRFGRIFVVGMLLFGVVLGFVAVASPGLRAFPLPPFTWPLVVALIVDLALLPLVREGRVAPLTMNERAFGVIGASLIYTVILALNPV